MIRQRVRARGVNSLFSFVGRGTRGSGVVRYYSGRGGVLGVVTLLKIDVGAQLIAMDLELVLVFFGLIRPTQGLLESFTGSCCGMFALIIRCPYTFPDGTWKLPSRNQPSHKIIH